MKNIILIAVFVVLSFLSTASAGHSKKKTIQLRKQVVDTCYWEPNTLQFLLYNKSDSLLSTSTISYNTILSEDKAITACIRLKNDTLYEYIRYDSCLKTSATQVVFENEKIHYVKQPLLLSNPAEGCKKEEFLVQFDSSLKSTMIVYFDPAKEKGIKKSVAIVLLKKIPVPVIIDRKNIKRCKE